VLLFAFVKVALLLRLKASPVMSALLSVIVAVVVAILNVIYMQI
jgi:hypothetical protein